MIRLIIICLLLCGCEARFESKPFPKAFEVTPADIVAGRNFCKDKNGLLSINRSVLNSISGTEHVVTITCNNAAKILIKYDTNSNMYIETSAESEL